MPFFREINCCRCKEPFQLEYETYQRLVRSSHEFFCPFGHKQHFIEGESEAEKLRRECDRLKQRIASKDEEIAYQRSQREAAERSAAAQKGVATKLKKRAVGGACPCCNRTFVGLARHIATKHPEFRAEALN